MASWQPSAFSADSLAEASATLEQAVSYGNLQDAAIVNVREGIQILECLNPALRQEHHWEAFLWCVHRHWAVVVRPRMAAEPALARVDTDLLRRCQCAADLSTAVTGVPVASLFIVLELLVPPSEQDFFLRLCVFPAFEPKRNNTQYLGGFGPLRLAAVAEHAIQVICHYRSYGLIGCNCQHFAVDLLQQLGIQADACVPDDRRAEKAAAWGVQACGVSTGVAKGVAATGAASAGKAGVAALLSAHVALGCAVGFAAGTAIHYGYQWLCQQHRKADAADPVSPREDESLRGVQLPAKPDTESGTL